MKRLSVLLLGALALFVNACEKHPASELPAEHATEFGEHSKHAAGHGEGEAKEHHEAAPAAEHAAPVPAAEAATPAPATGETKPGEAPKFFPEKK